MFKSRIEIREFAVRQAVELLGTGSPQKDIVAKARDIEAYIIGEADLPEVYNDTEAINGIMGMVKTGGVKSLLSVRGGTLINNLRKG